MYTVTRPRVVFLPGALGSVLLDTSLTADQARDECRRNLGTIGDSMLRGSALYPCDKHPESLWGAVGSVHWLFRPETWQRRITSGNGRDTAGSVQPGSLLDVDVRFRRARIQWRPYAALLKALQDAGADVLVVPYDWRLSHRACAQLLQRRVLEKWFGGRFLEPGRKLREDERITFIGHSMGGLIARFFLESQHKGHLLARRLITIGTPHLGAPQAYLHLVGRTLPLPDNPFYRQLTQAGLPAQGGVSAQFVPARIQTDVFRFMSSAFEVLPVYDFVRKQGSVEPFAATYRPEVHAPTGRPAMQVIAELRQGLTEERRLDEWLRAHDLEYHFMAGTGIPTALGYDRSHDRIITGREGDGTVPLSSALVRPAGTPNLRVKALAAGGLTHQRLCERQDVQAYCLAMLAAPRGVATVARPPILTTAQLRNAWRTYECAERRMVPLRLFGKWNTLVNPATVDAWRALEQTLVGAGHHAHRAWVYNCRDVRRGSSPSLHAYGLAIDIDHDQPACNVDRATPDHRLVRFSPAPTKEERCRDVGRGLADTSFTPGQVAAVEAIRTSDGHQVFAWGGRWRSHKDTMHFQINVTPDELARGIRPDSVGRQARANRTPRETRTGTARAAAGSPAIDLVRATRYLAVASPSRFTNNEWKVAEPGRSLPDPVHNDYALMKVLYMLRLGNPRAPIRVHAFRYEKQLIPLDFSGLRDSDVIFIAGHGNEKGLYTMGPNAPKGVDRLVEVLTADGYLKKHRTGKKIIIVLLSCRAGLGFHKGLARRLSKKLSIDTVVGGAQGFTFGSIRTAHTAQNEVLIRGIPWIMEYPGSLPRRIAENETSAREGKTITVDAKKPDIERFLKDKTDLQDEMKKVVQQLRQTDVNKALDEIDTRFRARWRPLLQSQFELYALAKKRSNLEFDMWFERITDGYLWADAKKTTDAEVNALITGNLLPVDIGLTSTR